MFEKKIQKKINNSQHVIVFKGLDRKTKYLTESSLYFYQGIPEIKTTKDVVGMNVEKFAELNHNLTNQFVHRQIKEEKSVLKKITTIKQDDAAIMLANDKLIVFDRWYETAVEENQIIGLYGNATVKQISIMELYEEYLKYFSPNKQKGMKVFCKRFQWKLQFPNMKLTDSTVREIIYLAVVKSTEKYRIDLAAQTRRNIKHALNESLRIAKLNWKDVYTNIYTTWKDNINPNFNNKL